MSKNPSPQRIRKVAYGELEPQPPAFAILPHYSEATGLLIAFTVEDPEADIIRSRAKLTAAIHKEYPGVSMGELEGARIAYYDYRAVVVLPERK